MEKQEFLDSITPEMVRESCLSGDFVCEYQLEGWKEEVGKIVPIDPIEPKRGRETIRHYFANLPPEKMEMAINNKWPGRPATPKQMKLIKWKFSTHGKCLVREDFSVLEASMLLAWLDDFDNLAKKPRFDLSYVI